MTAEFQALSGFPLFFLLCFFSNFFFLALLVHLHRVVDLSGADAAKCTPPPPVGPTVVAAISQ